MNRIRLLAVASAGVSCAALLGSALALPFEFSVESLSRPQSSVPVMLPDGTALTFTTRATYPEPGMAGVSGRAPDGSRLALFIAGDRILSGDVRTAHGHFQLVPRAGGDAWIRNEDNASEIPYAQLFDLSQSDVVRASAPVNGVAAPAIAEPDANGHYVIDLLLVHTPLFEARYGGPEGVRAEAQRLVFLANTAFENTGLPVRYRALAIEKYTGTTESAYGRRNMRTLARDPAIRAYRDKIGADLVVYLRTADGRVDIAIATLFNGEDKNVPPQDVNADRDAFAVTVTGPNAAGQKPGDFIFAHELGHTLGGGHNWLAHTGDGFYWQAHAHGFSCGAAGASVRYASVMSYGDLDVTAGAVREARGDFFSSPDLLIDGTPCGTAADPTAPEAAQADNASIITQAAPYVAAYREAKR